MLDELRQKLDPADRTLLLLRLDQDLSYEEIGRVLSQGGRRVTPGALRKRYERLKVSLAAEARRRGLIQSTDISDPPGRASRGARSEGRRSG